MFDWKRIKLIAAREIRTRVAMKSYRISLIVQVVIVALLALSPIFIAKFAGDDDGPTTERIMVVDNADVNALVLTEASLDLLAVDADTAYNVTRGESTESARNAVDSGDVDAAVIVDRANDDLEFTVVTSSGDAQSGLAQVLISTSSVIAVQDHIQQTGLSAAEVHQVFAPPPLEITAADPEASTTDDDEVADVVNYVIAYASTIIIFLFVVIYGQWVSQGVVEEKASRIMEIMLNAANPRDLLAGKVVGIMITALMQFVPIALTVGIIASLQTQIGSLFGLDESQLFNIDFGAIAWSSMGWFLLYFILGFLLYGALYAGVGSLVSRQEEVSTAVAPMTTVMMVGYFAALMSLQNPDGLVARISFIFPGTSVFVAMLRLVSGNPQPWEIALSARLYRVGVLMYGQPPKISQIFRLRSMEGVSR